MTIKSVGNCNQPSGGATLLLGQGLHKKEVITDMSEAACWIAATHVGIYWETEASPERESSSHDAVIDRLIVWLID